MKAYLKPIQSTYTIDISYYLKNFNNALHFVSQGYFWYYYGLPQ